MKLLDLLDVELCVEFKQEKTNKNRRKRGSKRDIDVLEYI